MQGLSLTPAGTSQIGGFYLVAIDSGHMMAAESCVGTTADVPATQTGKGMYCVRVGGGGR